MRIEAQKPNTSQKRNRRGMIDKQLELVRHWVPKTQFKPTLFVDEDNDLVGADVVRGRTLTSYPTPQTDIRNAGGERMDEEMATDQGLMSGRKPDDLPAFCAKIVEEFAEGKHYAQARSVA